MHLQLQKHNYLNGIPDNTDFYFVNSLVFQAENQILLVDGGHYETERFTKKLIHDHLIEKLPNFAIALTKTKTNPVNYI